MRKGLTGNSVFIAGLMAACSGLTGAQDYPHKTVRIVTSAPGGGTDFAARLVATGLTESLRQPVIVENRSGAVVSGQTVAKASPDGYTVLLPGSSFWLGPLLQKMPYDPITDFEPITITHSQPVVLVVHPTLPVKSVREFIEYARARPGELNYGSTAVGSSSHLAAALFSSMTDIKMIHVPFKGGGGLSTAMLGGQVQLTLATSASVVPHIKSGKLRGLGVASAQTSALVPGIPTIASAGVSGFDASQRAGMFAPARTPPAVVNRLNRDVIQYLNRADVKEKFFDAGVEVVGSTPQELARTVKGEMERMGKVIRDAGIRVD